MTTAAKLRAEARRCLQAAAETADPEDRKRLTARALDLAQQAEAMERTANSPPKRGIDKRKPD